MREFPFQLIKPIAPQIPLIVSVPHSGVEFPSEIADDFLPDQLQSLDDTDWFVDQLYSFVPTIGGTLIHASYSRWVIDLNREPDSTPLYDDGRLITSLCPTTNFLGEPIYKSPELNPSDDEIARRVARYFCPYHEMINKLIDQHLQMFSAVIFWDGHSIRRRVSTIAKEPFPDMILGTNDGTTASNEIISAVADEIAKTEFTLSQNFPFKGGFLTRSKGAPARGIHALQLEMSKDIYMSNNETRYSEQKAELVKNILEQTLKAAINEL